MNLPSIEKETLEFWRKESIFKKSLERTKNGPRFVFYEGPPFANGLPGIHHLLTRAFKDVILRYKTMQGFYVERKAGWDTHGLPTEMEAEKKLNIRFKKEIEQMGIEKFIEESRRSVFTYKKEWEEFSERIGFWLDFDHAYITCDNSYIETLWWILKQIWQKGFLYQDYKVVPYCPRCGTSLSSHEVAQGYKKIKEPAITARFELVDEPETYFLAWTTTPWTLPANVALAVNPEIDYVKFSLNNHPEFPQGVYIVSEKKFNDYKNDIKNKKTPEAEFKIIDKFKGSQLIGKKYKPLYKNEAPYKVVGAGFVSVEEGTGIVHIAPAFGEDDMSVGKENNLPVLMTVDEDGKFIDGIGEWKGIFVKNADPLIIDNLRKRELLFQEEMYEHDYPFCWRCKTPLLYYAKNSWFINVSRVREQMIKNNETVNWVPPHIKKGRFGEWLNEIKDWNLSRERYWGTPLPVWECEKCKKRVCVGSVRELEEKSGQKMNNIDLHRPFVDNVVLKCECGGLMKRVPEVIDCWFDSGSMPFAQWHYPFENKDKIDNGEFFPADFIAEGMDQTRGWFYTLLAISTLLGKGAPYKNVISLGLILDANGQKMSKSRGNIIVPKEVVEKFGADCARLYFYTINKAGEAKKFDFKEVQSLYRKFFITLVNSYAFFSTYVEGGFEFKKELCSGNLLDRWIVSRLENLKHQVIKNLDKYDIVSAARFLVDFVDDLSNWYIRLSRRRFQKPETEKEKEEASQTLYYVLLNFIKLTAPFTPFVSEYLYRKLKDGEGSVHLADYPKPDKSLIDAKLEKSMAQVREIVAQALAKRSAAGIKVRQPLSVLKLKDGAWGELKNDNNRELLSLIKQEINVKNVIFDGSISENIELDVEITPELKEEGLLREIVRQIQIMRKKANLKPSDKIFIIYDGEVSATKILEKNKEFILREIRAVGIERGKKEGINQGIEIKVDGGAVWLGIKGVSQ